MHAQYRTGLSSAHLSFVQRECCLTGSVGLSIAAAACARWTSWWRAVSASLGHCAAHQVFHSHTRANDRLCVELASTSNVHVSVDLGMRSTLAGVRYPGEKFLVQGVIQKTEKEATNTAHQQAHENVRATFTPNRIQPALLQYPDDRNLVDVFNNTPFKFCVFWLPCLDPIRTTSTPSASLCPLDLAKSGRQ